MKFYCELKKVVDDSYDIEIGHKLSDTLINDIQNGLVGKIKKFAVVTDSIVENLYAKEIFDKLIEKGFKADLFVIPEGEKSKTRPMKEFVEDSMLNKGYRRDCCVLAIGGGVGLAGQLSLIAVTHILLCYLVSTHLHNAGLDDILDILYMDRMGHACDLVSYILRYRLDLVRIHLMQFICLFISSVDRIDDLMQVKIHFFPASLDHSFV